MGFLSDPGESRKDAARVGPWRAFAILAALSLAVAFGADAPAAQTPAPSQALASPIKVKACARVADYRLITPEPPPGTVFLNKKLSIKYIGGPVVLSEDCDGTEELFVNDELLISRGSAAFRHDYSNGCSGRITSAGPHDVTSLFRTGVNKVRVRLKDLCGGGASSSDLRLVYNQRCKFRKKTGNGYADLRPAMKAALDRLYRVLEGEDYNACYKFTSGFRSQEKQDKLYERWHEIADKPKGDTRTDVQIHNQLKAAGFAQLPTGYKPKNAAGVRVAKGGPAKVSRHTSGLAADVTVLFPDKRNLGKYQAAAADAGLCGPPKSDPVHVETPYSEDGGPVLCHFPPGPAP